MVYIPKSPLPTDHIALTARLRHVSALLAKARDDDERAEHEKELAELRAALKRGEDDTVDARASDAPKPPPAANVKSDESWDRVDEAAWESFPASDPPSNTPR